MKRIDYDVASQMRSEGMTYSTIAQHFGTSKQAVQQLLSRPRYEGIYTRTRKEALDKCVFKGLAAAIAQEYKSLFNFSRVSGIPYTTLYYICRGTVEPRYSTITAICALLGKTYEELFTKEVDV